MDCDGGEPRGAGIWRYGPAWARHVCAAAPWLTLAMLLLAFAIASTKFVRGPGVPFELPENGSAEAEDADVEAGAEGGDVAAEKGLARFGRLRAHNGQFHFPSHSLISTPFISPIYYLLSA